MVVIVDMVDAVAEIALAPGAVAEFQLRMLRIGPSADHAPVGVGRLGLGGGGFVRAGLGEGNHLGAFGFGSFLVEQPPGVEAPGHGEDIGNIPAEEEEIVGQGDHGEQRRHPKLRGPAVACHQLEHGKYLDGGDAQIEQGKDPCLHRDDEKQQKLGIREHGGVGQKEAQIQ